MEKDVKNKEQKQKKEAAFLKDDYPYKAIGEPIEDLDILKPNGVLYEIKCNNCEMSIRSQGINIKPTYEKLMAENGCIGCGNKELVIKEVDMTEK